jgi:hypothetical protein
MQSIRGFCITLLVLLAAAAPALRAQGAKPSGLRIVVIAGEDAVNVISQRTAVAPIVEVRDRNNQPVAGAIVTFSIQGAQNATFAGASTLSVTTNAIGQAAVTGLTPTGAGAVQINVAAAFQGQTATAAIAQTNVATAAQAGGGIGAGKVAAIAGGAAGIAGGVFAFTRDGDPPTMSALSITPTAGLATITPVRVGPQTTASGDGAELTIDFGDGTTVTVPATSGRAEEHVYQAGGAFSVRATITDSKDRTASASGTVTIKTLTGRWNVGTTGAFFTLTQTGTTIGGAFTATTADSCGVVTGSVRPQATGNVSLTVTAPCPGFSSTFTGSTVLENPDVINGTLTTGTTSSNVQLIRQ